MSLQVLAASCISSSQEFSGQWPLCDATLVKA